MSDDDEFKSHLMNGGPGYFAMDEAILCPNA
jgi:hypothetical protein